MTAHRVDALVPSALTVAMSALFLAAGSGDGLLMATEVGEVPLRDAVVFLSACETGGGTPTVDGVLGLSRAFLKAGARAAMGRR